MRSGTPRENTERVSAAPTSPVRPAGAAPARPARQAGKATGAWADGDRTPLNPNEEFKQADDGLNVRQRIETIYSRNGFASDPRRRPAGPDALVGPLHAAPAGDRRRQDRHAGPAASWTTSTSCCGSAPTAVRSPASSCAPSPGSARSSPATPPTSPTGRTSSCTGSASRTSPRSGSASRPSACMTTEACGDTPRVILGSPVAGIAADEIIDGTPAMRGDPATATSAPPSSPTCRASSRPRSPARRSLDVAHEVNDVSFVGVVHPELGPGFDVWVGGGLSTNPMFAQRLGAWVSLEEIPEVWVGVVSIFRDYGYRRLRNRARLKFLVADWGAEKFREVLENEYLGRALLDGPGPGRSRRTPPRPRRRPPAARRPRTGSASRRSPAGSAATSSRGSPSWPPTHGSGRVRLTAQQKLVVLDVTRRAGRRPRDGLAEVGMSSRPHRVPPRRRWPAPASSSASWPSSRPRPAPARSIEDWSAACPELDSPAGHPRQRLPELVRPVPGRRHRTQGPAS